MIKESTIRAVLEGALHHKVQINDPPHFSNFSVFGIKMPITELKQRAASAIQQQDPANQPQMFGCLADVLNNAVYNKEEVFWLVDVGN